MPTTPNGVWYPDENDPAFPLESAFATLASSVDDKLGVPLYTTTAARDTAYAAHPFKLAAVGSALDVATVYVRSGNTWLTLATGADISAAAPNNFIETTRSSSSLANTATPSVISMTATGDTRGSWSTPNGHVQISETGWYALTVRASFSANTKGRRIIYLRDGNDDNPTNYVTQATNAMVGTTAISASTELKLNAGDLVRFAAFQDSGATLTVSNMRVSVREIVAL